MSLRLVQERLRQYGATIVADGQWGPASQAALDAVLPPKAVAAVAADPAAFFARVKASFGPLTQQQVDGFNTLRAALAGWPISWQAYALATTWHETARTMQPIKEMGGEAYFKRMYDPAGDRPAVAQRLGNVQPGDGVKYAGRGYVQLTGRTNYARYGIADTPNDALKPDVAAKILRDGMEAGRFTGKKLGDYLPGDYFNARRIINGLDKAEDVAAHAAKFEAALAGAG